MRVGITDYAQDALGDVVFVSLPDVGTTVTPAQPVGEIESTKSVSDLYAPVAGDGDGAQRRARRDARADQLRPVRRGLDLRDRARRRRPRSTRCSTPRDQYRDQLA